MSTNNGTELKLKLYPMDENEFIATIWIEDAEISRSVQTVILLDRSLYMGCETRRFTNEIIPLVMSKLSDGESQPILFITFANFPQIEYVTAEEMKSLSSDNYGRDRTRMASAIKYVHAYFQGTDHSANSRPLDANKPIRLLSISAGEAEDLEDIEQNSTALIEFLDASDFSINAQAVRLFTSSNKPDTKALCSLLQINNATTCQLINIDAKESNDSIATKIAEAFQLDQFSRIKTLTTETPIILKFPWNKRPSTRVDLIPGLNIFWLNKIPTSEMCIKNSRVKVIMQDQLTLTVFQELMEAKLSYIVDHMNVLKATGSAKAKNTMNIMLKYFNSKEDKLGSGDSSSQKRISALLASIVNENDIEELNFAVLAEQTPERYEKKSQNFESPGSAMAVQNIRVVGMESPEASSVVKGSIDIEDNHSVNIMSAEGAESEVFTEKEPSSGENHSQNIKILKPAAKGDCQYSNHKIKKFKKKTSLHRLR